MREATLSIAQGGSEATAPAPRHRPVRPLVPAALLAAVIAYALFFYRDLLFQQRVYVYRDQYTIILAVDHVVRWLSQFDWPPLWTPFQVLGKPLAADPLSAVYYPFNWGARLLPWPLGYNASLALHHVWAAAGMYGLLRRREIAPLAAAFGGLLFGFGGLFVGFDNMLNALQSSAWAPWTLLAFDLWCAQPTFAALAATAIGLAMTLLGGMPEVFFFENALFAALAIDRRRTGTGPPLARVAVACVVADALAIGLGSVQLVPTAEYVLNSSRATGLNPEGVMRLALRPLGILAFLVPRHFVDPNGNFHETAALWEGDLADAPWALTLYLGPVLAFAAVGGAALARFQRRWWLAVGLVFIALALGPAMPGYRWLVEHGPLLRSIRYPEKFLLVVDGLLVIATALGLDNALREPARFRTVSRAALALGALAALGALVMDRRPDFAQTLLAHDLGIAAAGFVLIAGIAALGFTHARAAGLVLLVLTAVDLYRVNGRLLPTVSWDEALREPTSARTIQRGDDPPRIYSDGIGRPAVPAFPDGFLQEQNLLLMEVANYYGIDNLNAPASINLRDHEMLEALIEQVPHERVAPLFAAFNTAYVTSPKSLQHYPGLSVQLTPASPLEAYLYRVDGVVPRAYVPATLEPVGQGTDAIEYLRHSLAPAERVAVERDVIPPGLPATMAGSVRLDVYRPQDVELSALMQTDGLVVLTDTFYPGWEAVVDGVSAPIVRANYFARGVFVRAGERRIVFRYRPVSYRVGVALSLVTGIAMVIGVGLSHSGSLQSAFRARACG